MTTYSNIRYAAAGVTEYATADDLPTTAASGSQAFVAGTNRLYIWNGTGWYNIALINTNPTISGVSSSYDLAQDGTATTVTITAADPEGLPITYSLASDTSGSVATVAQGTGASTNVFTITPSTSDANAGTFTLTFRASDGVNIATAPAEFSLGFKVVNIHYTSALITSVGANNAVNNTFIDSSSNSHTITASGDATQSTFSPYRHGGYSAKFTGSASYFATDNTSVIGTGDFTWEAWVKTTDNAGSLWMKYNGGNQADGINLIGGVVNTHTNVGQDANTGSINVADGNWHYIVVERYNGTLKTFVDGTEDSSVSSSENASRTGAWFIGKFGNNGGVDWAGEIKDLRFSHDTAEYQGSFSSSEVPTETVTARSSTTIILFTGKPYFENGTATSVISSPTSPYDYEQYSSAANGYSTYFDGSGDYLSFPDDNGFELDGDFTIEFWFNRSSVVAGTYSALIGGNGPTFNGWNIYITNSNGAISFFHNSFLLSYTEGVQNDTWYHVAVTRSGTDLKLFVNGVERDSATNSTTFNQNVQNTGGRVGYDMNANGSFNGSLSDIRVVKGTAVYASAFTPPTAPLTAITGTSLLLKGANAGIIDKSQSAQAITLNGDVKSSTTQYKYLTSSMYFDPAATSATNYITAKNCDAGFSTGDFTVECWIWPESVSTSYSTSSLATILDLDVSVNSGTGWFALHQNNAGLQFASNSTAVINATSGLTAQQWNHVAVVRNGTTVTVYIDGVSQNTVTNSSVIGSVRDLYIGRQAGQARWYEGYISDVRITKGLARYTAAFTPPTAALKG